MKCKKLFKRGIKRLRIDIYRYILIYKCPAVYCSQCNSINTNKCNKYLKKFKWII